MTHSICGLHSTRWYSYSHVHFKQNASTLFYEKSLCVAFVTGSVHTRLQTTSTLFCVRILFPRVFGIRGKNNSFVRFGDLKTVVITVGRPSCCLCMIVNECKDNFFFFFRRVISKDTLFIIFLYILTIVVVFCLACPVFREIHCLFPRKLMTQWVITHSTLRIDSSQRVLEDFSRSQFA